MPVDGLMRIDVVLKSAASKSYRCQKAANSLDIDVAKKLTHELHLDVELGEYNVGLVVGASGSGKTTLARKVWGKDFDVELLDGGKPILDQFPESMSYDECQKLLTGVGLSQVVCWLRPARTLSNGQRVRAEVALRLASDEQLTVIDEWTSVVDRTVGKAMSHCIARHARREGKQMVLLSCHSDVIEWLDPDWIIDCNKHEFVDRRLLRRRSRKEEITFDIFEVATKTWKMFSKYHYLSERLPGGHIETFGVFHGDEQIGFQCFANYVPWKDKKTTREKMHSNRTVIHPDYVGFGLGMRVINETSRVMVERNYDVWAKFSSVPISRGFKKHSDLWALQQIKRTIQERPGGAMQRATGFREKVKTYSYRWVG